MSRRLGFLWDDRGRTQLAEVLYIGLDDVAVELFAVLDGEEDGIELPYGAYAFVSGERAVRQGLGAPRLLGVTAAKDTRVGDGRDMGAGEEQTPARRRADGRQERVSAKTRREISSMGQISSPPRRPSSSSLFSPSRFLPPQHTKEAQRMSVEKRML